LSLWRKSGAQQRLREKESEHRWGRLVSFFPSASCKKTATTATTALLIKTAGVSATPFAAAKQAAAAEELCKVVRLLMDLAETRGASPLPPVCLPLM